MRRKSTIRSSCITEELILVSFRFQMGRTLWSLGYPDQALRHIAEAVALARTLSHPLTLIMALAFASVVHLYRGEADAAGVCVDGNGYVSSRMLWRKRLQSAYKVRS